MTYKADYTFEDEIDLLNYEKDEVIKDLSKLADEVCVLRIELYRTKTKYTNELIDVAYELDKAKAELESARKALEEYVKSRAKSFREFSSILRKESNNNEKN